MAFSFASCSQGGDDPVNPIVTPRDTTNNGGGGGNNVTGLNTNPDFSLYFNGQKSNFQKFRQIMVAKLTLQDLPNLVNLI